jgi:hypothetical protein
LFSSQFETGGRFPSTSTIVFINKKNSENNQSLDSFESKIAENQNVFADGFPFQQ